MEQRDKRLGRLVGIAAGEGYSLAELADLLGSNVELLNRLRGQYRQEYAYYRVWGKTKKHGPSPLPEVVLTWALENGRWPIKRDLRMWNGLPSPGTYDYYTQGWADRTAPSSFWMDMALKKLPWQLVITIPNLTARRVAIERIGGPAGLIKKGGGRRYQQDDYGTLWRIDARLGDERDSWSQFVEVVNSTRNPDGSYDHYFLRVPPGIQTAKDAVAWTGWFEQGRFDSVALPARQLVEFEGFFSQS